MSKQREDEIITMSVRCKEGYEPYPPAVSYNLALIRTLSDQERKDCLILLEQAKKCIEEEKPILP